MSVVVALIIAVPLGAAALVGGANRLLPAVLRDTIAVAASATVAVLAVILVSRSATRPVVVWFGGWHPDHGMVIGVDYVVDPLGAALAALAGLLAAVALLYSRRFFEKVGGHYPALVLVFTAASVDFAFSGDLFNMFVAFELVAVTAFVLTGVHAEKEAPLQGAINFAVTNTLGGLVLLAGVIFLYGRTGTLNLAQMGAALAGHRPDGLVVVAFALLAAGFFTKAAIVPFHFWLPDAYGTAPVPVCVLFAGVMSELGLFGLARVWESVFSGTVTSLDEAHMRIVLCALGALTALVGTAMALVQTLLRRMLGFVTVAHMGLYLAGFGLLHTTSLAAVAVMALGDGLVKAALFLAAGVAQLHRPGQGRLWRQQRRLPIGIAAGSIAAGALALADLPPFASSTGKDLLIAAAGPNRRWLETLVAITVIGSSGALLRYAVQVWTDSKTPADSELRADIRQADATKVDDDNDEEQADIDELATSGTVIGTLTLTVPPVALLLVAIAVGLVPHLDGRAVHAAASFADRTSYANSVLRGRSLPGSVPATPATSSSALLIDLLEAAGTVAVAIALLAQHALLVRLRSAATVAVAWLRHLHSGHVGDQVTWQILGIAVLAGLSALALR
ncbi:MAG: complex I subunit 5 family protein [Acidimicrobiales bacterium]